MNYYFFFFYMTSVLHFHLKFAVVGLILQIQCNLLPPHQLPLPSVNPPLSPALHYNSRFLLPRIPLFHPTDMETSPLP